MQLKRPVIEYRGRQIYRCDDEPGQGDHYTVLVGVTAKGLAITQGQFDSVGEAKASIDQEAAWKAERHQPPPEPT